MMPSALDLARHYAVFCVRARLPPTDCAAALGRAARLAAELTGAQVELEPAAMLFALTFEARALLSAWPGFPIAEARRLGRERGLLLNIVQTPEIENMLLDLVQRRSRRALGLEPTPTESADFAMLCAFLATCTQPLHLRPVQ
jgi:hypothetical protein